MNRHIARGELLLRQHRNDLAVEELRLALAEEPGDSYALSLLALGLGALEQFEEAQRSAAEAITAAPDSPFAHYAMAVVLSERRDIPAAIISIREAIRLDPGRPENHALQGSLLLQSRRWEEALASADRALSLDPDDETANNVRAMALVQLGRRQEAGSTLAATLARNPEDSWTHANLGWTLLHEGDGRRALPHFQEALRLDPNNEWARQGVVEALKASNPLYALLLRYFLWMNRLSRKAQWAIVIGGWFGNNLLADAANAQPSLAPWVLPIRIAYLAFAWLTWSAEPLFNLLLRLNRFGRLALSEEQRDESTWIGACVGAALFCLALSPFVFDRTLWLLAAGMFAFLVMPIAARYNCQGGWPRRAMSVFATIMAISGIGAFVLGVASNSLERSSSDATVHLVTALGTTYVVGLIACPWIGNILQMIRIKR